jgi:hypothetical protein
MKLVEVHNFLVKIRALAELEEDPVETGLELGGEALFEDVGAFTEKLFGLLF